MRIWIALCLVAAALAACGKESRAQEPAAGAAPGTESVLRHHRDPAGSGLYVQPSLTWEAARQVHRDPAFKAALEGPVYAQPLYWTPTGGGRPVLVIATERNLVYALDAASGAVVWRKSLGKPAPRASLPCGNIEPLGVTGTPAIDPRSQAVYLDAMVAAADGPRHMLFGLSLRDGAVLPGWPVDVAKALGAQGKTFIPADQNQRGGVTILGDRLYVPYGGHFGDCGRFRGWVVSVALGEPARVSSWSTRAAGGGIWAPGGIVSDGHALYLSTGNTMDASQWGDGEAVIRLGLDLAYAGKPRAYFSPADWRELDEQDLDLGGTNPVLVDLPGARPAELVVGLGKDGNAYVLDRADLGGIGRSLRTIRVSNRPIRTAPATYPGPGGAYIAFEGQGAGCPKGERGSLTALRIAPGAPPALSVAWCADGRGRGAPIVTTIDGTREPIVWMVGAEGDNRLHGFRGDTGAVLFDGGGAQDGMDAIQHFQTLIAAGGRLYVAGDRAVYAFRP